MALINKGLWAVATILIFSSGIYYSIKLKFPQLSFKTMFKYFRKKENTKGISSKDTLIMALSSKIGAGSLSGVAFSIYYGGIGTIFWMWISAFFSCINSFLENALAIIYRNKETTSGPASYIKKGLNKNVLACVYAIIAIFTYNIGFSSIQNNTITTLVYDTLSINKTLIALIVSLISGFIIIKGLSSISNICNKIFPLMSILYIAAGLIIILINIKYLPMVFIDIIKAAFTKQAIEGGILYTILIGIQKGIFANEAGIGTGAIISGATDNDDYIKQGYFGIITTYFISIFITTITAIIIILSDFKTPFLKDINGIEITKYAFNFHFGTFGEILLLIILLLFSFSSIITVYYYGESNLKSLIKSKSSSTILKYITIISIFIGGIISSSIIWNIVDICVAILAIINIYAIFKLKDIILKRINPTKTI